MEYRYLGRTGLKVSPICLGTMQFGWSSDEQTAHAILSRAVDLGCNFIDTADVYSRWVEGNPGGVSEEIIGNWLKKSGVRREQVVIATKVREVAGADAALVNVDQRQTVERFVANVPAARLDALVALVEHAVELVERNVNTTLVLTVLADALRAAMRGQDRRRLFAPLADPAYG